MEESALGNHYGLETDVKPAQSTQNVQFNPSMSSQQWRVNNPAGLKLSTIEEDQAAEIDHVKTAKTPKDRSQLVQGLNVPIVGDDFKEYIATPSNEKPKEQVLPGKLDLSISDEEFQEEVKPKV